MHYGVCCTSIKPVLSMSTTGATDSATTTAGAADQRPWGVWASLVWYLIIFEGAARLYDFSVAHTGLQQIIGDSRILSGLSATAAWGIQFLILVLAVRMTRIPLRGYLAWTRPQFDSIALGILAIAALYAALVALTIVAGGGPATVSDYRSAVAAGASPWWFVLRWWPSFILAPFVEESFFRGFLWRSVQFRFGDRAAFALTSLLFAAIHYDYWAAGGVVDPVSVVQYLVTSAIYGWVRWRGGSTIATMIVHGATNLSPRLIVVLMSALLP